MSQRFYITVTNVPVPRNVLERELQTIGVTEEISPEGRWQALKIQVRVEPEVNETLKGKHSMSWLCVQSTEVRV